MSSIYGKGPKGKATRLHSLVVRSRGRCERCGSTEYLQAAHIIGRKFSATRTDETNAWCLCAHCHARLTDHPDEHLVFAEKTIGMDAFYALKDRALANRRPWTKAMWEAEAARLQALLDEVTA